MIAPSSNAICRTLSRVHRACPAPSAIIDEHVGKAMRQVEVPAGLRTTLHRRLAAERGRGKRGRLRKYAAMAAAAAMLAMVGLGFSLWQAAHPPALDIEGIFDERNHWSPP